MSAVTFDHHIIRIGFSKQAGMDHAIQWFMDNGATITKMESLRFEARWDTPEVFHRQMAKDDDYTRIGDEYHRKAE